MPSTPDTPFSRLLKTTAALGIERGADGDLQSNYGFVHQLGLSRYTLKVYPKARAVGPPCADFYGLGPATGP